MRYIKIDDVKEGMVLAVPLLTKDGGILLNTNVSLNKYMINSLKVRGYRGIHIYDTLSRDIKIKENIPLEVQVTAVQTIKDFNLDNCIYISNAIVENLQHNNLIYTSFNSITNYDKNTYVHSMNVATYSAALGMILGLPFNRLKNLTMAALLHDIGKSRIPISIINKQGKLTEDEYEIVKTHPELGYLMLKDNEEIPSTVRVSVLEHHENEDGSGYPLGLRGNKIYLFAKIIHICDVYDALISTRSYKTKKSPNDVLEYIMGGCGSLFDYDLVKLFISSICPYPEGMLVKLSNGLSGVVKKNNKSFPTKPKVLLNDGTILNLASETTITITDYDD